MQPSRVRVLPLGLLHPHWWYCTTSWYDRHEGLPAGHLSCVCIALLPTDLSASHLTPRSSAIHGAQPGKSLSDGSCDLATSIPLPVPNTALPSYASAWTAPPSHSVDPHTTQRLNCAVPVARGIEAFDKRLLDFRGALSTALPANG